MPHQKLIFVTMHADSAYAIVSSRVGASGSLLKRSASRELMNAIESGMSGNYFVIPLIANTSSSLS